MFKDFNIYIYIHIYIYIYIFNLFPQAGFDTKSILKRILTVFNSEFPFSESSWHNKVKEPSLPYCLPLPRGRIVGFILFSRYYCYVKCKQPCPGFELWSL